MSGQKNQPGVKPAGGFTFGSAATGSSTGFNFVSGATSTPAPTTQASIPGGFSFGASQPTAAPTATPFRFGSGLGTNTGTPSTASTGLGFSNPSTAPGTTSGFAFSGTTQSAPTAPATSASAGGFSFGGTTQSAPTAPATSALAGGFSFGGAAPSATTVPSTSATTGGLTFGATASAAPATAVGTGISFGAAAKPNTTAAPPIGGFNFGGTPSGPTTGFTLGGVKPAPTTTIQGGLTLGGISSTTPFLSNLVAGTATTTPSSLPTLGTTTQPTGGFQLGSTTAATSAQTGGLKLGGATTTPATGTVGSGLLLGQTAGSTGLGLGLTKTTTGIGTTITGLGMTGGLTTSTGTLPFGTLGASKATTSGTTTSATTTSSAGQVASTTSSIPQMTYKQLEEQINKWASELEDYERTFLDQAGQVNAWDRLLMENGEKITELNGNVESVKAEQKRLDEELDFILAQQQELEVLLKPLEEELKKRTSSPGQLQHADREREFTYGLAKDIDGQLKQMVGDLKAIIDHLNAAGSTQQENNDPIVQVAKILNAHMNSLQWIDQNAALLQRKVDEVSSLSEIRRKEQERNFRLAFD